MKRIASPQVAAVFKAYPRPLAAKLMALRRLIFDTASKTEGVGELEETLKWGQPSYVTAESGSGSTIRIDQVKSDKTRYAIYFHCQTTLVDTFKEMYRDRFEYEGNRALILDANSKAPMNDLAHCISMALTYKRDKKRRNRSHSHG